MFSQIQATDHYPARITKADFSKKLSKKLKKRIPLVLLFLAMKINKNIQPMYQKNAVKINMLIYY